MKVKHQAFLPFVLLSVLLVKTATAQTVLTVTNPTVVPAPIGLSSVAQSAAPWIPEYPPSGHGIFPVAGRSGDAPLATRDTMSYFDPTTPRHDWLFPFQAGTLYAVGAAERFTLPSVDGYVDSVMFYLDGVVGDSLTIAIDQDTVITTGAGQFHFVNIFSPTAQRFAGSTIPIPAVTGSVNLKFLFPHVHVTKNFHVVLLPRVVSNGTNLTATSQFLIRGDSEATRTPNAANAHSTFLGINLQGGTSTTGIMDGYFTPSGDAGPLYSNFAMSAYVTLPSGAAVSLASSTISGLQVFPNPANSEVTINLSSQDGPATVELRDMLGRTVSISPFSGTGNLNVNQLVPGRYEAIVHTQKDVYIAPVLIQR